MVFSKTPTREELNNLVDRAADLIRTAVDYKFILVLLFIKRVNDVWKSERQKYKDRLIKESELSEKDAEKELDRTTEFYSFNIPKQYLWDEITKDTKNLPTNLATAINEIAKLNTELQGVINRIDFLEFARNQENRELLRQLVEQFNKYDLDGTGLSDIFGDAYEHIIMKFAPQKAKEGEIYTPREVTKLLIEMLGPHPNDSVYDPCCGSGGMLISSYIHVKDKFGLEEAQRLFLFGQERNAEIYAICQMNLILHGIKNAKIENGDTLEYPKFKENGKLKQFNTVVANPPWNQDGYGEDRLKKVDFRERFSYGYSIQTSADWAWIQHMLASTKDGKVGIVIDNGCLFRGSTEKKIRSKLAKLVDCVILLPEKLFYNTGAPGAIIIFDENKSQDRKDKILFINASNDYIQHPNVRRLNSLSDKNIKKIVSTYKEFETKESFSRVVDLKEIKENDFNFSVALYVTQLEKKEKIDLKKISDELKEIEKDRQEIKKDANQILAEIIKVDSNGDDNIS